MVRLQGNCRLWCDLSCSLCTFLVYLVWLRIVAFPPHMADICPFCLAARLPLGQGLRSAFLLPADCFVLHLPWHLGRRGSLPSWPLPPLLLLSVSMLAFCCYSLVSALLSFLVSLRRLPHGRLAIRVCCRAKKHWSSRIRSSFL